MNVTETPIEGLLIIEPRVFNDLRGCFFESFSLREFRRISGLHYIDFVQDNESHSTHGVIRGLHFQRGDHAQAKLVRVTSGRVLDVAVDLRPGSTTYGQHFSIELSADNKLQLFLPRGFAHGFAVLSPEAVLQYKVDNYYCPESEGGISPTDPTLAIDWHIDATHAILSPKDLALPPFLPA
ncbi:MAG: dTDP-4-dehydrorhamnose 3,5-epimerase [Muribaculaceae bacterium]|nr:dTDP-4-dehydrorhamnose 3,5-epimerase [Muribaculaceae bacterium]